MTEKELQAREKQELEQKGETTREGRYFRPDVDIFEREDALVLVADVPGATTEVIDLDLQDSELVLTVTVADVDKKWKPIHREYEIGHYMRQFRIGQIVDTSKISAQVKDGVLSVTMPKVEKAKPRKIEVAAEG